MLPVRSLPKPKKRLLPVCLPLFSVQIPRHRSPQTSLCSSTSPAIAEELERFPGICRLVDDLYIGSSRAEARKREEKLGDVIRILGNRTARQKLSGQTQIVREIDCGVFCTAEYLPQGYSTLVRCLLLQVEDPFDSAFLSYIQRRPLAWPTFCFRFLSWCACHYDTIVKRLSKMRNSFERQRG